MRKILISHGFGAGWTSWYGNGTPEQKRFMLEYKPFIEALEQKPYPTWTLCLEPRYEEQFLADFRAAFPDADEPYTGGMRGLRVHEVDADEQVSITEYDGAESFTVRSSDDGWL